MSAPACWPTWSTCPTTPAAAPTRLEDYKVIAGELKDFGHGLPDKPVLVVATKADSANPDKLKKLQTFAKRRKLPFYTISAVTGEGGGGAEVRTGRSRGGTSQRHPHRTAATPTGKEAQERLPTPAGQQEVVTLEDQTNDSRDT